MNSETKQNIAFVIFVLLFFAIGIGYYLNARSDCDGPNETLVRGDFLYECVQKAD